MHVPERPEGRGREKRYGGIVIHLQIPSFVLGIVVGQLIYGGVKAVMQVIRDFRAKPFDP